MGVKARGTEDQSGSVEGLACVPAPPLGHGCPGSPLLSPPSLGAWPEQPLQAGLCVVGHVSWAAELHGGTRATAVGPSNMPSLSISRGAAGSPGKPVPAGESCVALKGCSVVIPVSFEMQPDSAAPTLFRCAPRGKPTSISSAASELTLPLFLAANKLLLPVFQASPSLLSLWAWSPAAEHTLQPPSAQGPKRKTEKQRSAAGVADWQLESPGQVARTLPSRVSGMRRRDNRVPTGRSPAAGSQVPKCQSLGMALGASSILPSSDCALHALQALLPLSKKLR